MIGDWRAMLGRAVRPLTKCRLCGSPALVPYLDLGHTPPADEFRRPEQLSEPSVHYPLVVCVCSDCGFSQLTHVVAPEILYQVEYPYESSTTEAGRTHFRSFARSVVRRFELDETDLAVDIGSNVGVLLSGFQGEGVRVVGVDPATNIAEIANRNGIKTHAAFFGDEAVDRILAEDGRASVVTATNVFAHVDDLDALTRAVDRLLAPSGIFIFEAPLFANLLERLEYDTIYHEHLSYISITPLVPFFERFGMRIFDVREVDLHGGSVRVFVDRGEHEVHEQTLNRVLLREEEEGIRDMDRLRRFAADVEAHRTALTSLIHGLRAEGARVAAISAPAKGSTLLNYCRFGPETIDFVTEKSALKIGRLTPGTHIPVVPDAHLLDEVPDYALLLAWNFADEIMANLSAYADAGGRFIIPIPSPRVIGREREKEPLG